MTIHDIYLVRVPTGPTQATIETTLHRRRSLVARGCTWAIQRLYNEEKHQQQTHDRIDNLPIFTMKFHTEVTLSIEITVHMAKSLQN